MNVLYDYSPVHSLLMAALVRAFSDHVLDSACICTFRLRQIIWALEALFGS